MTKTVYGREGLSGVYGSEGWSGKVTVRRQVTEQQVRAHTLICWRHRDTKRPLKPQASHTPPPTRPYSLILPKQFCLLGPKKSNI